LAITLPPLLEKNANRKLDPPNPVNLSINSSSVLEHYPLGAVSSEDLICSDIGRFVRRSALVTFYVCYVHSTNASPFVGTS